jgi:hypothetical protein
VELIDLKGADEKDVVNFRKIECAAQDRDREEILSVLSLQNEKMFKFVQIS